MRAGIAFREPLPWSHSCSSLSTSVLLVAKIDGRIGPPRRVFWYALLVGRNWKLPRLFWMLDLSHSLNLNRVSWPLKLKIATSCIYLTYRDHWYWQTFRFFYGIKTSMSLFINVFILTLRRMYQRVIWMRMVSRVINFLRRFSMCKLFHANPALFIRESTPKSAVTISVRFENAKSSTELFECFANPL